MLQTTDTKLSLSAITISYSGLESIIDLVVNSVDSPESKRSYRRHLGHFLAWYIQRRQPELNAALVKAYRAEQQASGLGAASINLHLVEAAEYSPEHTGTKGSRFKQKMPEAARNRAIILLLLDTGLRLGKLCRLKIEDVNMENGEVLVAPFGSGKKTKPRTVVIGKTTRRAVWLYLAKREDYKPEDPLFDLESGAIRTILRRAGERAVASDNHPHRFRHSFAIWFLRNGGDVFTLQRLLGHSTLDMTRITLTWFRPMWPGRTRKRHPPTDGSCKMAFQGISLGSTKTAV